MSDSYPCPCCGHPALDTMPGSYEICPVCFWEDDGVQFRWPTMGGGANRVSLIEAQRNYQNFGACDEHGRRFVRPPAEDEPLDPAWRPIDLTRDSFEDWAAEDSAPLARRQLGSLLVAPHFLAPGPLRVMTSHIETLVQQLDGKADESYDARAELIWIGADAIPAVINGLPSLGGFGQLTAIEVFEEVGDPRCGPVLISLLDSDNPTVREWAAIALASLEIDGAIEPLRRAYRACLERATPPDWSEPEVIRWALTELGARTPVVPPLTARLRTTAADNAPGWPSTHFTEIINDLADHTQVILYSQFWRVDAGRTYGVSGPGLDWELDWTAPWEHLVEESRTWSLLEASEAPIGDDIFVAPTWIDRTDLYPER